ncbi:MAG: DUF3795 domain-containing protein [Asgard group archaeon]|nr:DUF3795 domain-containing protein [Asgard group archaeon]
MKFGAIARNVDELLQNLRFLGIYNQLKNFSEVNEIFNKENEFYIFLNELKENFGECSGCRSKGLPSCEVRKCAINKKINLCPNCKSFNACAKIKFESWQSEMFTDIKQKSI